MRYSQDPCDYRITHSAQEAVTIISKPESITHQLSLDNLLMAEGLESVQDDEDQIACAGD